MNAKSTQITSTQYHDEIAACYDDGYKKPYWRIYNEITWNYIDACLPEDKSGGPILDAGGGTGLWAVKLAKLGYEVVLTDISEGMLEVARRNIAAEGLSGRIRIVKSDIVDMKEFNDGIFSLVLAEGDCVSYCSSPDKAIGELSRVAKAGAYITVSVDSKLTWLRKNIDNGSWEDVGRILHEGVALMRVSEGSGYPSFVFTPSELSAVFVKNGLQPVKAVGKPVFAGKQNLDDAQVYDRVLKYELAYGSTPDFACCGGHIAVVGRKV